MKKFLDTSAGMATKTYLLGKLEELKSIDNISNKDVATHQAIEVKAQKRAYLKLKEIMEELITFDEEKKEKDERDSFAVL
jgi:hypothetical protein